MEVALLGFSMSLTWLLIDVVVLFILYDYWCHSYWRRRGVVYEPALPIIASSRIFSMGITQGFEYMKEKHGNVYGMYFFRQPVLVVGEPEMLRQITVKSFNHFHDRAPFPQVAEELKSMVSELKGERWREVRNSLTPTFSGAKMKQMSHLINNNADSLIKHIGANQKEKGYIECQKIFGSFVMDTVGSCAFGLDIDSQSDPANPFVTNAKKAFQFDFQSPLFIIGTLFPALGRFMTRFRIGLLMPAEVLDFFKEVTKKAVSFRKGISADGSNPKRNDFLQLLIDAQKQDTVDKDHQTEDDDDGDDIHAELDKHHDVQYHSRTLGKRAPLTDDEVFGQVLIFFTAGSETTTTLLGFIFYALSMHPEIQEKLIQEVDKVTPSRDSVGYKSIASMPYLDQVVCETMRLYPPAAVNNRVCTETFEYNGTVIEKGVQVFIPTYTIHRDPDYWPEPEKFDPERFTKEARVRQHPFAWIPFGAGPRNCVGMRFALMETKMAVVRTLQNYRFETCAQTEIPPTFGKTGFLTPANGITLKAVPRTDIDA